MDNLFEYLRSAMYDENEYYNGCGILFGNFFKRLPFLIGSADFRDFLYVYRVKRPL